MIASLQQDLRYGLRSLRRAPRFTAVVVIILGVTIGATTAVFAVVNLIYFSPLPWLDPARLVVIHQTGSGRGCTPQCRISLTIDELRRWSEELRPSAVLAAGVEYGGGLSTKSETIYSVGAAVSANFFQELGVKQAFGRGFTAQDDEADAERVMLLSHTFWREAFGGDSAVVGHTVRLNKRVYRIVGVMPAHVPVGEPLLGPDEPTVPFFVPIGTTTGVGALPDGDQFTMLARLNPSTTPARFLARVNVVFGQHQNPMQPAGSPGPRPRAVVVNIRELYSRKFSSSYPMFLAAAACVLALACFNVACLFLAHLGARQGEFAVRLALGAGTGRLVRQLFSESALVAITGSALGLLLAKAGASVARVLLGQGLPYWAPVTIDTRVFGFSLVAAAMSALAFGVLPAWIHSRTIAPLPWRRLGRGSSRERISGRRALVTIQIGGTLVLLCSAGLLGKTFVDATGRQTGWAMRSLVYGVVGPIETADSSGDTLRAVTQRLVERLEQVVDVTGAAARGMEDQHESYQGMTRDADREIIPAGVAPTTANVVTAGYFKVISLPLVEGREFLPSDGPTSPSVAILDEPTARRLFPRESPVGRRVKFGGPSSTSPWMTIVGVVGAMNGALTTSTRPPYHPLIYRPLTQAPSTVLRFVVHTRGSSAAAIPTVRTVVGTLLPDIPIAGLSTVESFVESQVRPLKVNAVAVGTLALLALSLATLGIYGIIAQIVGERTVEIGIRIALGAMPSDSLALGIGAALKMLIPGLVGGVLGALTVTRLLDSMIYDTSPTDQYVFGGAIAVLVVVGVVAGYLPARRAMLTDPARVLRDL